MNLDEGRKPAGRKVFRAWLAASVLYVAAVSLVSIEPVGAAIETARLTPAPSVPVAPVHTTGPIHTPESPTMKAAEVAGRQALIALAPPLLLLWFGWDLWFAVSGLLQLRRTPPKPSNEP